MHYKNPAVLLMCVMLARLPTFWMPLFYYWLLITGCLSIIITDNNSTTPLTEYHDDQVSYYIQMPEQCPTFTKPSIDVAAFTTISIN